MNLSLILSKIGLSVNTSQNITLVLVLILLSFVFAVTVGRRNILTILINIYASFAIASVIPEKFISSYSAGLLYFLIILVILFLFSKKILSMHISVSGSGFLWRIFLMSFLEVVLLVSIILSMVPKKIGLEYVSGFVYEYLVSDIAKLVWMVAPLVFILIIHKRITR